MLNGQEFLMAKKRKFADARQETFETRKKIGFPSSPKKWKDAKANYSEHELVINNHPVMEDWESDYMQVLASIACSQGGKVLEIGFGMGISSGYIQSHDIVEHVIIEANSDVFDKLIEFAKSAPEKVTPIFGFWQNVTKDLPDETFDGILFDTYPLQESEVHKNHFDFFVEAYRLLKNGGILTYYSDEINDFSPEHRLALERSGFKNINMQICDVNPPADCLYWKSKTIVAPIVRK
ncbi:MAG: hypothetical protein UT82_C0005G0036 [Parcubacteria group bacterium GW2011_GWB1_40_14]|nr:MAG: hypothetical protein UT82_C0005G0036 [Parcubacteria group bacterium GW2011_GWB1_40_14]